VAARPACCCASRCRSCWACWTHWPQACPTWCGAGRRRGAGVGRCSCAAFGRAAWPAGAGARQPRAAADPALAPACPPQATRPHSACGSLASQSTSASAGSAAGLRLASAAHRGAGASARVASAQPGAAQATARPRASLALARGPSLRLGADERLGRSHSFYLPRPALDPAQPGSAHPSSHAGAAAEAACGSPMRAAWAPAGRLGSGPLGAAPRPPSAESPAGALALLRAHSTLTGGGAAPEGAPWLQPQLGPGERADLAASDRPQSEGAAGGRVSRLAALLHGGAGSQQGEDLVRLGPCNVQGTERGQGRGVPFAALQPLCEQGGSGLLHVAELPEGAALEDW
jgi:hypothetical protein